VVSASCAAHACGGLGAARGRWAARARPSRAGSRGAQPTRRRARRETDEGTISADLGVARSRFVLRCSPRQAQGCACRGHPKLCRPSVSSLLQPDRTCDREHRAGSAAAAAGGAAGGAADDGSGSD
jgi:hypothetical protein